jgi:hypothetical protein
MSIKALGFDKITLHLDEISRQVIEIGNLKGETYSAGAVGPRGQRYEHYVQGKGLQSQVHQGRWQHEGDVLEMARESIVAEFDREVAQIVRTGRGDLKNRAMQRALNLLRDYFREYPPPPANSKYQRTMTLKNSWLTRFL